jgi:hypothetical protein
MAGHVLADDEPLETPSAGDPHRRMAGFVDDRDQGSPPSPSRRHGEG